VKKPPERVEGFRPLSTETSRTFSFSSISIGARENGIAALVDPVGRFPIAAIRENNG
jgi:hypothetical protein